MPVGNPRYVAILEDAPATAPDERLSTTRAESPSDAAYTATARPAGPAPTTITSYVVPGLISGTIPSPTPASVSLGRRSTVPFGQIRIGKSAACTPRRSTRALPSVPPASISECG